MEPTSQILLTGLLVAGMYSAFKAVERMFGRRRETMTDFAARAGHAAEPRDLGMLHPGEDGVYVPVQPRRPH